MNNPTFLITSVLNSSNGDQEELRKKLFENGIMTKDYPDDGLMLLYHKFDSPITNELERECRSLVIDRSTLQIKSYSCETPRLNKEGMDYLITHSTNLQIINPCYEGTLLSVFYHGDKWYVSTRRCLNSNESIFCSTLGEHNEHQISHYDMFNDVLRRAGYLDFNDFSKKLNQLNSYYFVLIHHKNKNIIDYSKFFGENYACACLTTIRDCNLKELDIYEQPVNFAVYNAFGYIFVPVRMESYELFTNFNKIIKYNEIPENEGIVIRVWNNDMNKFHLIKLQTVNYQFSQVIGTNRNIFKGLIYLYQNDKLVEYFAQNPNCQTIRKIINPLNTFESFDTIGMIDAVFKVCTSELFELFKLLWSFKTGQQQNKELYNCLPKEYRDLMYAIRGLFFTKKALFGKNKNQLANNINNKYLKINDIYNYLKILPTEIFVAFLRMRKLMFNWANTGFDSLNEFKTISKHCDAIQCKLCAIFTNKLFPNIMPDEIPPQEVVLKSVPSPCSDIELTNDDILICRIKHSSIPI